MGHLTQLYGGSLSLLTDLYQLTMAYGYWKEGVAERETVFHLSFRKNPFNGGFAVACGLEVALDWVQNFHFSADDCDYLGTLTGNDGKPLFEKAFLQYLSELQLCCDIHAIPEGEVVFGHEPLLRVQGPVLQCQLLETALLNIINFQTLVATKAARVCLATGGESVLEFGARRAQSIDGALSASRAAYIGGCGATSDVLAGKLLGIPVRGTHAHSWVMLWGDELEAFEAYARSMPNNCVFLVDTYDTLEGVRHAIRVGEWLRERGHTLNGIRLDSGDLAWLSAQARQMLDEAGFQDANIVASNDLDEEVIASLKMQGSAINVWGVGTRLVTGGDQSALGGVYKLSAIKQDDGSWQPRIKLSEQSIKISNPGILQVRRFVREGENVADMLYDVNMGIAEPAAMVDPNDFTKRTRISSRAVGRDLLEPVFRGGKRLNPSPDIHEVRAGVQKSLSGFHGGIKRFVNPHLYPVGVESTLHDLKTRLILEARQGREIGSEGTEPA
jgi:nicotinate phosphoribosyltransferase